MTRLDDHSIGIAAGILSAACFGLTGALVNRLANAIPASEITFFRGLVGVFFLSVLVKNRLPSLFLKSAVSIWVRAISGAVSILCFSWNLQLADVGTANILFNLSLFLVLFADFVNASSRPSMPIIISMIIALSGIALYWYGNEMTINSQIVTLGIIGATAATIAYTALNKASRKYDSWLIVWAVSLMSIPISLLAKTGSWIAPSASETLMLTGIAIGVLIAHYLLNVSFARLTLPLATALGPSCIIWSVLGVAVFQGITPALHALLGIIIYTIGTGALLAIGKRKL